MHGKENCCESTRVIMDICACTCMCGGVRLGDATKVIKEKLARNCRTRLGLLTVNESFDPVSPLHFFKGIITCVHQLISIIAVPRLSAPPSPAAHLAGCPVAGGLDRCPAHNGTPDVGRRRQSDAHVLLLGVADLRDMGG